MSEEKSKQINKNMTFGELLNKLGMPAAQILADKGMHCIGCAIGEYETIEQGCQAHGLEEKEINTLIDELNKVAEKLEKEAPAEDKEKD
ncbi:DUF1858 domain-containing protein [Nanoarchaeota archaeon]